MGACCTKRVLPVLLLTWSASLLQPAPAAPSTPSAASPLVANTATPQDLNTIIFGHAIFDASGWHKHLQSGLDCIDKRDYEHARAHLSLALDDLRRHNISDARAVQTRLALGQAYLGEERFEQAERLFSQAAERAAQLRQISLQRGAQAGLAETLRRQGDNKRAADICRQLLKADEHIDGETSAQRAQMLNTLAATLSQEGLSQPAEEAYGQAEKLLEHVDGDRYQLAQTRYRLALELHNNGRAADAVPTFEKAFTEFDKQAKFDATLSAAPRLTVTWDEGSPRSRQIIDPEYPLKYVLINDLRVAATAVRSENVIAVLVSLANCGHSRMPLFVGPVDFLQLAPKRKPFMFVPDALLDVPLEQEHVTELTWRRRWLNHIEKNRYIPGFLKNRSLDVDNFFSNNTFGEYGNWGTIACNDTPIVTREEFYYGFPGGKTNDANTVNFLSRSNQAINYRPTFLDPGEAKTGLVFFKQERFDRAQLNITIGNTVVEIPINTAGPR